MTFRISAPIFVFREFHRHRIGWSYNEWSARYSKLEPVFHIPAGDRPLVNEGTSARPVLVSGTVQQYDDATIRMQETYATCYKAYEDMLADGIAKEVARAVLPVAIYSTMYATCNMRSLMAFLSLRVDDPGATFPSKPQYEIQQVALKMEGIFKILWPITHAAFIKNGRVSP